MKWIASVTGMLFMLAPPALADDKGALLVRNWMGRIGQIQPIVAETTTTYTYGKLVAVRKAKYMVSGENGSGGSTIYRYDNDIPIDLLNDPLQENLNPIPYGPNAMKVFTVGNDIKYLGKETVDGITYDVVQVPEFLIQHFIPPIHLFDASLRKPYNTLPIKWYFDPQGIVRRMTFTALPQPSDTKTPPPLSPSSGAVTSAQDTVLRAKLTVTMVVDSLRKPRAAAPRAALADPLFVLPVTKPANVQGFAFSPDGSLLAIGGQDTLQVIRTDTGKPAFTLAATGQAILVDFSQDGKYLTFSNPNGFSVLRTADGVVTQTVVTPKDFPDSVRMSPDGKYVATTNEGPDVKIWNVTKGALERTLPDNGRAYEAMFSPDGKRLATIGYNTDILLRDTATWQVVQRLPMRATTFQPFAFAPDSKLMAMVNGDNTIQLWDAASGKPIKTLPGAVGRHWFLGFSTDGQTLFSTDRGDGGDMPTRVPGLTAWNLASGAMTADYAAWTPGTRPPIPRHGVISPDGRFAAFRDGMLESRVINVFALPGK